MTHNSKRKLVILLTIDCLRPDHLRINKYHRNTAPNLEKFVKNGVSFSNAIANGPETSSSFSSIFTSILPYLNGDFSPLPNQKITFPQVLNENKIICYGIHSNPNLGRFFNYHRGFDIFLDSLELNHEIDIKKKGDMSSKKPLMIKELIMNHISKFLRNIIFKKIFFKIINHLARCEKIRSILNNIDFLRDNITLINRKEFTASYIVKKLINFIENFNSTRSLFIWAHFMDVHWPYNPPLKNLLKFRKNTIDANESDFLLNNLFWSHKNQMTPEMLNKLIDLYDGEINYVDEQLGKLFNYLIKRFKKHCLIIITADHGESFYEHKFLSHGGQVYDELLRVPLFIIELGKKPKIKRISEMVQLMDIAPTILDYFGVIIPNLFQGRNLFPIMQEREINRKDFVISESYQKEGKFRRNSKLGYKIFSIRKKTWKYIYDEEKNEEYLYNLIEDQGEKINLIKQNSNLVDEFRDIKNKHFQSIIESNEKSKIMHVIRGLNIKI